MNTTSKCYRIARALFHPNYFPEMGEYRWAEREFDRMTIFGQALCCAIGRSWK